MRMQAMVGRGRRARRNSETRVADGSAIRTCPTTSRLASSPIRLCALDAKPAKWPAKNGTMFPTTGLFGQAIPTTTRVTSVHQHGVT